MFLAKHDLNGQVKEDEMGRSCGTNGGKGIQYGLLIRKPEGERPLLRTISRWVNNTETGVTEIGWAGMNWIDLVQDRGTWRVLLKTVIKYRVAQNTGKFLSVCTTYGLSRRSQLYVVSSADISPHTNTNIVAHSIVSSLTHPQHVKLPPTYLYTLQT
jgi:hypothetical protein